MDITNIPHQIFTQEKAIEVAKQLTEGDPDWTYIIVNNPNPDGPKTAIIKIYDKDDEFVALL